MNSTTIYQTLVNASALLSMAVFCAPATFAFTFIQSDQDDDRSSGPAGGNFVFLGDTPSKWEPGLNSAAYHGFSPPDGPESPGGASWSAIPSAVPFSSALGGSEEIIGGGLHPNEATTTDIEFLVTQAVDGLEYAIFNDALNVWAAVANITNLGQVSDGATVGPNGAVGDDEVSDGHLGDIRVAGIAFDGPNGTLAHGFQPGTETLFGSGGTIAGDIHFDSLESWIDDPNDGEGGSDYDFFTSALHEIGHALGLDHSNVDGSVMEKLYLGSRRTLHPDDIAGIQALYGAIPEPSTAVMAVIVLFGFTCHDRRKRAVSTS